MWNRLTKKAYALIADCPRVEAWFADSDGVWISLLTGWEHDSLHSIHIEWCDYTVVALRSALRDIVQCRCQDCTDDDKPASD